MGWFEERAGLAGTVAVITGGAGGLGAAITLDLAACGVHTAVLDIDPAAAATTRRTLDENGHEAIVRHGDAREPEALTDLFEAVDERWGRLDTLVNVVGGTFRAAFTDTSPKGWDALLRANLLHVLHTCSLAVPRMRDGGRGGSIVNLTTVEAHRAAPGFAVYAAAKAAVEQFARTLAVEEAPYGIRVNNVAPDLTPTRRRLGMRRLPPARSAACATSPSGPAARRSPSGPWGSGYWKMNCIALRRPSPGARRASVGSPRSGRTGTRRWSRSRGWPGPRVPGAG